MQDAPDELAPNQPWAELRRFTAARVALGRSGDSLPTPELLAFQLAHAQARDAVHLPFDGDGVVAQLRAAGHETLLVHSAAAERGTYLRRPDLGRRLSDASAALLAEYAAANPAPYDAVFVVADGLSPLAVHAHAVAVTLLAAQALQDVGWRVGPVVVAAQARVALGDAVGAALRATQVAVLIGERPGLSAADSLGIYLTYDPKVGRTDAERNCISNIRPGGLDYGAAKDTLVYLMTRARQLRQTGVALKDDRAGEQALPG